MALPKDVLLKVKLLTAARDFVAEGTIPRFDKWPDVITWGTRIFVKTDTTEVNPKGEEIGLYSEGFSVHLVMDTEGSPREDV